MQPISHRLPDLVVSPFTRLTYTLIDAYVADGHAPAPSMGMYVGDTSAILFASDMLIERGTPSWLHCDADLVRAMIVRMGGFGALVGLFGPALLAFRKWLLATGRVGPDGIESLERFVAEAPMSSETPTTVHRRPSRAERRWRARCDRRARRR